MKIQIAGVVVGCAISIAAAGAQEFQPVTITAVSPKNVGAGREITVVIKGPSVKGRQVVLSIVPLESHETSLGKSLSGVTGVARYSHTAADNDASDNDRRDGLIMLKVPTDSSWAPPQGADVNYRRYGLVAWEADGGVIQGALAALQSLQEIRVSLSTELAEAAPAFDDQLQWLTTSAGRLKGIQGDAKMLGEFESTAMKVYACPRACVTNYAGFLVDSQTMKAMYKPTPGSKIGASAIHFVADDLSAETLQLYSAIAGLPVERRARSRIELDSLRLLLDSIKETPVAAVK